MQMRKQFSKADSQGNFDSAQKVYDCALNLLAMREFSEKELLERLERIGIEHRLALEALSKLKEKGLINERRYAILIYGNWLRKKIYGRRHLHLELLKHGISAEYVTEIMELFTPDLELKHAEQAAEAFCRRLKRKIRSEDKRKLYSVAIRFIAAKGFSAEHARVLLNKLDLFEDI